MAFIQLIEGHTDHFDELTELGRKWEAATEGRRTARRSITTRHRGDARQFVVVVFFDSYESAMENSNLPETAAFATELVALVDGTPSFHDLEVTEDHSWPETA
ncbi:MAG: hypothetical protein JWR35_405 [Marmoricola sp.]|jgi:hypothetical protein|nr:hypothetical protein [Marmoricola sp.]